MGEKMLALSHSTWEEFDMDTGQYQGPMRDIKKVTLYNFLTKK